MPEEVEPDSHTLRRMRRIDTKLDMLADIARETCTRVGLLEQQVSLVEQRYPSISSRLDTLEVRNERIERRAGPRR